MKKISGLVRSRILNWLGIHEICSLQGKLFYSVLAERLLEVPKVFGDKERMRLGQNVVLNDALINTSSGFVSIGDFSFCGHGSSFLTGTHDYHQKGLSRQYAIPSQGRDIMIGKGVWIGSNATILGPCVVGDNAVIAAGAIVIGNVDANCIYAGVPAKKIHKNF